jgi:hypothetical protein
MRCIGIVDAMEGRRRFTAKTYLRAIELWKQGIRLAQEGYKPRTKTGRLAARHYHFMVNLIERGAASGTRSKRRARSLFHLKGEDDVSARGKLKWMRGLERKSDKCKG